MQINWIKRIKLLHKRYSTSQQFCTNVIIKCIISDKLGENTPIVITSRITYIYEKKFFHLHIMHTALLFTTAIQQIKQSSAQFTPNCNYYLSISIHCVSLISCLIVEYFYEAYFVEKSRYMCNIN